MSSKVALLTLTLLLAGALARLAHETRLILQELRGDSA